MLEWQFSELLYSCDVLHLLARCRRYNSWRIVWPEKRGNNSNFKCRVTTILFNGSESNKLLYIDLYNQIYTKCRALLKPLFNLDLIYFLILFEIIFDLIVVCGQRELS